MTTEEQVVERLHLAIATASNDDYSKPGTDKRQKHIARIDAMSEAADTITRLVEEAEAPRVGALAAIADIREVTGLGAKPMLTELATAVKTLLSRYAFERDEARQQLAASEAKVAELQEALKPFAEWPGFRQNSADSTAVWTVTIHSKEKSGLVMSDFARARRALERAK